MLFYSISAIDNLGSYYIATIRKCKLTNVFFGNFISIPI